MYQVTFCRVNTKHNFPLCCDFKYIVFKNQAVLQLYVRIRLKIHSENSRYIDVYPGVGHHLSPETPRGRRSTTVQLCLVNLYIAGTGVLMDGIHYFAPQITVLYVAITARTTPRDFLIWMERFRWTFENTGIADCGVFMRNSLVIGERNKESTTP